MNLSGNYFEYNGISSRKYGLIFAHIKTKPFESLIGETETTVLFNKRNKKNYIIDEKYDKAHISFQAEVVTAEDHSIDIFERREIEKWLFHKHNYGKLYVDMDSDDNGETYEYVEGVQKRLYLNCRLLNPEKIEVASRFIGYRFDVECDSCMAWQDKTVCSFNYDAYSTSASPNVIVDTDLDDYVYPRVIITTGSSGGDITIINISDDATRATSFVGLMPNHQIIMNGDGVNYISGDDYSRFSNKNFIRLLDGENNFSIIGNVSGISFEFQNRRYL